ncbi:dTDP-4-dehydrorhamnose reductase [uncultured Paraglaciecola sp.]|uniref:dTDP-4-dehydrorhamnose reductase n=1 Tax=uncultured Paraglaciecola sp. TaxID=1765024 RepID=UPI0025E30DE3|nr:dTDP-4-dehydrorhamnose reductase [uncultured Paraglaciecola sp.]
MVTGKIGTILVTGSSGQLGQSLKMIAKDYSDYGFTFAQREQLDLSNGKSITAFFKQNKFDLIINCAAYTAVDKAESEPELADKINHIAVKQLAELAKQYNTKLIHISTDYVFNGQNYKPYIETDEVAPQSVYGETKLKGEQALLAEMPNSALIIRTSWVYSEYGNNFVKTMLRLGKERDALNVIFDQIGTPTYAHDLAQAIMAIVSSDTFKQANVNSEIYHYSNEGVCSWYDFSKTIFELSNINCDVSPIETKDYPTPAMRPHYSLLNKAKIKHEFNLSIPYWKESLKQCLKTIGE